MFITSKYLIICFALFCSLLAQNAISKETYKNQPTEIKCSLRAYMELDDYVSYNDKKQFLILLNKELVKYTVENKIDYFGSYYSVSIDYFEILSIRSCSASESEFQKIIGLFTSIASREKHISLRFEASP